MRALLIIIASLGFSCGLLFDQGKTCSRKCQQDDMKGSETSSDRFLCSCSSSCALYGDCCVDSPFKSKGAPVGSKTSCLLLSGVSGINNAMAVSSCPETWKSSSYFCESGLGYLPPVTSTKTGVTYTNVYCAICNGDDHMLKTWNVRLSCCKESKDMNTYRHKKFVMQHDVLWLELEKKDPQRSKMMCSCDFVARTEDFIKGLEVRPCSRTEISRCSMTWRNMEVRESCKSYLDPVYVGNKIYRNRHCALCNYEEESELSCVPDIVSEMWSRGYTDSKTIIEYCKSRKIDECLHFMMFGSRGISYAFSEIIAIRRKVCVPPKGRMCCDGYMYDSRHKKCRKLMTTGRSH